MSRRAEWMWLTGVMIVGLAARAIVVLALDPRPDFGGGDSPFYLTVAQNLANGYGFVYGWLATYKVDPIITTGPVYPAYLALFYILFDGYRTHPIHDPPIPFMGDAPWIMGARLGQAVIGTLTVAVVYALVRQLFPPPRAGNEGKAHPALIAAGIMALDLRFIVECGAVYTETVFTFLLLSGLALYVAAHRRADSRWYAAAWIVIGLAAMTRPMALVVYPALFLHLWLSRPRAQAIEQTIVLAGMLALVLTPWLVRNYLVFGRITVVGDAALSHFWLGAIRNGEWEGFQDFFEQQLLISGRDPNNPPYLQAALATIAQDPLRFVVLIGRKLGRAYLQPPGTVFFRGPSLKEMLIAALAGRSSLLALLGDRTFWPKLTQYVFHFGALLLGLFGMWRTRRRWGDTLALILVIAVVSGTYAMLTIIPRYLLPILPLFTVFAAEAIGGFWARRSAPLTATPLDAGGEAVTVEPLSQAEGG